MPSADAPAPGGRVTSVPTGSTAAEAVTALPGVDLPRLAAYLRREVPRWDAGRLSARLLAGGRSNLTYLLSDGRQQWVLRRPPLGHVLETAHDMGREHRVMSALAPTEVPVPEMIALCCDADVLGAPFYVMEFADGTILRSEEQLSAVSPGHAEGLADALVDVLVRLHDLDPAAVGLGDLGRPEGYLDRQVRRWTGQLAASHSRDVPGLQELADRLAASTPRTRRHSIVHGDYRLDNVVIDMSGDTPAVQAVLDWEMATLGDPLADLASMVIWWDGIAGLDSPVAAVPGEWPAFPPSARMLERYGDQSGLEMSRLSWYLGFAYYKVAAIFEGIHYRNVQGLTVGEGFDRLGAIVEPLVQRGHQSLDEGAQR